MMTQGANNGTNPTKCHQMCHIHELLHVFYKKYNHYNFYIANIPAYCL